MWEISSFGLRSTVSSAEAGRSIEINQDLKLVVKKSIGLLSIRTSTEL